MFRQNHLAILAKFLKLGNANPIIHVVYFDLSALLKGRFMSSIPNAASGPVQSNPSATQPAVETWKYSRSASADPAERSRDTVEISDEAKQLLEAERTAAENKPFSYMEYEKVLVPDSKDEKKFKELVKSVKAQKNSIMSRIEDALRKNGVSPASLGKIKLEVDGSGKIVAGGIDNKEEALAAIERALNQDKGLATSIKQFQRDEKELSKQIRDYTGCSLHELTMTAKGDINKRVRDRVESFPGEPPTDEWYWKLGFLGETLGSVVSAGDVADLSFNGGIDFSGETNMMADPEGNIKDSMRDMTGKIQQSFEDLNKALLDKMKALGVDIDEEFLSKYMLNLANVKVTVDNHGAVVVEGRLAEDEETNQKGIALINQFAREMLNDFESNSYHLNPFTESSDILLAQKAEKLGLDKMDNDARVVAEIVGGVVGGVKVSSPRMEARIEKDMESSFNRLIADQGIAVEEPVRLEVDEFGKLRATDLVKGAPGADEILALLGRINAKADETDPAAKDGEEEGGLKDMDEMIGGVARHLARLRELRD